MKRFSRSILVSAFLIVCFSSSVWAAGDILLDGGRQIVGHHAKRVDTLHNRITLASTTETTLIAAGGAGVFRDLVLLVISNESASEVRVDFRDSTGGTIRLSIDLASDGGGAVIPFSVPLVQATTNNNWTAQLSAVVSTVYITAQVVER